jgi:hypothetical protein
MFSPPGPELVGVTAFKRIEKLQKEPRRSAAF